MIVCPNCEFIISKQFRTYTDRRPSWVCPACDSKHTDVFANICPTCKIDFNSKEFDDICREKGLI